jgi:hypothetical protein
VILKGSAACAKRALSKYDSIHHLPERGTMGYYIRVLALQNEGPPVSALEKLLKRAGLSCSIEIDAIEESWKQITVLRDNGETVTVIERSPVAPNSLGSAEIGEFIDGLADARPTSAADWLRSFLPTVKAVFAFQILNGARKDDDGWAMVHTVQNAIWGHCGGILQADGEGFSNLEGLHILSKVSDGVSGPWSMALLNSAGGWTKFRMDLGNLDDREQFKRGEIPVGAESISEYRSI